MKARDVDPVEFTRLWNDQVPVKQIAEHFRIRHQRISTIAMRLGLPKREIVRTYVRRHVGPRSNAYGFARRVEADAKRLMAKIPEDTRTPAQRLMGEPLPGRTALDMEGRG